jgi:hypothetical protein
MKLLVETLPTTELTRAEIKVFDKAMANGTVFREWSKRERPGVEMLVKAFKYEVDYRERIRISIFHRLIELYNKQFITMNWATASELVGRKVA